MSHVSSAARRRAACARRTRPLPCGARTHVRREHGPSAPRASRHSVRVTVRVNPNPNHVDVAVEASVSLSPVSPRRYSNLACATMAFKTRPSVYRIDIAPTSRARCRGPCKQTICKGDLRIAITAFVRPNRSTLLARCYHCIDARFASAVLAVYGTADRVPPQTSTYVVHEHEGPRRHGDGRERSRRLPCQLTINKPAGEGPPLAFGLRRRGGRCAGCGCVAVDEGGGVDTGCLEYEGVTLLTGAAAVGQEAMVRMIFQRGARASTCKTPSASLP